MVIYDVILVPIRYYKLVPFSPLVMAYARDGNAQVMH